MSASSELLASALGVSVRTVERLRRRPGFPCPTEGEDLGLWAPRANAWRKATRRKPGPRVGATGDAEGAQTRYRIAKAELAELELAERRAELHSRNECELQSAQRLQDLLAAFKLLPARMARRLYQAPSPEFIQTQLALELRRCFEVLASGGNGSLDPDAEERAPVADGADGQPVG